MIITTPAHLTKYIWLNGELVGSNASHINLLTHSLHYSGGVFEGERAYGGKVFKLKQHTERLLYSAKMMQLEVPYNFEDIIQAHELFIKQNEIVDAYVRPFIFRGSESLNMTNDALSINLMIAATHSHLARQGGEFNLHISRWKKPAIDVFPPQVKSSGHYNMVIVAQKEAKSLGFNDAVMLDSKGFVAEATTANIFFVKDEILYTPIADSFLNGITRQTVIELAAQHDIKIVEKHIELAEIQSFDECFVTGTAAEIKYVNSITIDNKKISFASSKVTEFLKDKYNKLVRN